MQWRAGRSRMMRLWIRSFWPSTTTVCVALLSQVTLVTNRSKASPLACNNCLDCPMRDDGPAARIIAVTIFSSSFAINFLFLDYQPPITSYRLPLTDYLLPLPETTNNCSCPFLCPCSCLYSCLYPAS